MKQEKMYNNCEVLVGGLKCDNPKCDWRDDTILFEDYEKHINARCPKCGQNVLTEKDYENALLVKATADFLNTLSPEELLEFSKGVNGEDLKTHPLFENAKGLELLDKPADTLFNLSLDTHNGISVSEIKLSEPTNPTP